MFGRHSTRVADVAGPDLDDAVRSAAFTFLAEEARRRGDGWPAVLPWDVLARGFLFDGHQIRFLGPQGIFKPAILPDIPLSIATAPPKAGKAAPYDDEFGYAGLRYRYRGVDPDHRDNVGLRRAMALQKPLVYLHGIVKGQYLVVWPVFVVGDERGQLAFTVVFDEPVALVGGANLTVEEDARRSYALRTVRQRMHQAAFRERVLDAYRKTCAVCRLRHVELLDAAHILPDGHPRGQPVIANGLALCKLHHAAFDANIIGVRPDLVVEVRRDVLDEIDGPMLQHGLQGVRGVHIWTPRASELRPTPARLEERYELFRRAS